jgi:Tfp pilus assembly protein PilF
MRLPFALAMLCVAAGCAQQQPTTGLADVMQRPAERALMTGLRAYDDAQYAEAERALGEAVQAGLASAKDRALAFKHLAFIYCTSRRTQSCEQAFRDARTVDPQFALSKAESGHPLWGPVYTRVTGGN